MMMQEEIRKTNINNDKNCKKCEHFPICALYRHVAPYIAMNFGENTKPFEVEELAKICRYYSNLTDLR